MDETAIRNAVQSVHNDWFNVHREWFEKDRAQCEKTLRRVFVRGNRFHMFNLDGNVYRDSEDIIKYWHALSNVMEIVEAPRDIDIEINVSPTMATIASRFHFVVNVNGNRMPSIVRGTELYRLDDGEGNPTWCIWHCHYSTEMPPPMQPK